MTFTKFGQGRADRQLPPAVAILRPRDLKTKGRLLRFPDRSLALLAMQMGI